MAVARNISMIGVLVVVVALFSGSAFAGGSNTVTFGPCVKPTVKTDFDINQYGGLWYEYEKFPVSFEAGLSCVQAYYTRLADQNGKFQVNVTNAGIKEDGSKDIIFGNAIQSWQPGVLKVKFAASPVYGTYKVLDTDYSNFACVYSCINFFLFKIEYAWVLTRSNAPAASYVTQAEKVFSDKKINTALLQKTTQTGCNYAIDSQGRTT